MMLAIFLGLKNTPLSPIAGRSYESLNVLHRWCGYTTILITVVHTAVYAAGLVATDYVHLMTTPGTIGADVAGIAMVLILLTANGWVRRRYYETFYLLHTILVVVVLITGKSFHAPSNQRKHLHSNTSPVCYHTSKAGRNALYMALIATGMYTLNRVLRWTRFFYYIPSNTATLTPLHASNATRVTLTRSMHHAAPGSHAFLYIPSVALLQSHPFTMVSQDPIEFVVSAQNGFTKALFEAACEKPGRKVRAAVEGAYGCVPDVSRYDTVVVMAGGSGATFAFALAVEWAKKNDAESKGRCIFVWSVRTAGESR
jgi:predicted ferric reductase